jgi:hypothetical protein
MKIFSARASPDTDAVQKAQGCLATNLALPGLGSLAGGRKIGVFQLILCFAGFAISLGCGVRFVFWTLAHWSEFYGPDGEPDPLIRLHNLWQQARWPFLGVALFAVSWFWSLLTSWSLLAEAKGKTPAGSFPR